MPRRTPTPALPSACADCSGTGETPAVTTRRKSSPIKGQLGVCLTCLGTGTALDQKESTHALPHP